MTSTSDSNKISIECNLEGHREKLTNVLYCQWLEESSCCDLQLQTPNGVILVHTCVITAFSPRIADAISVKEQKKRKGKSVQQCVIDVGFDYHTVKTIVKSIYTGVFTTTEINDVQELYGALTWFEVEELQDIAKSLSQDFGCDFSNDKIGKKRKSLKKTNSNPGFKDILKKSGDLKDFLPVAVKDNGGKGKTKKSTALKQKRKRKMKSPKKSVKAAARMKLSPPEEIDVDLDTVKTEVMDDEIAYMNLNPDGIDDKGAIQKFLADGNENGTLKCSKCKAVFTDLEKYQSHINDHPTFTCDKCQCVYFTGAALFRHMRKAHFKTKHLKCSSCDFVATSNSEFSEHCLTMHNETEPFQCQFEGCTYKARKYGYLSRHFEVHESLRSFQCDKCEKYFKSWACLGSHRRSCYDVQKYLCDLCGQSFNHSTSMKTHRRAMHFGERPYKCHVCTKSFSENGNLKRHLRIHNNTYPYSCPVCSQPFRHSNTLKSHMNKHGGFDSFDIGVYQNEKKTAGSKHNKTNKGNIDNNNAVNHFNPLVDNDNNNSVISSINNNNNIEDHLNHDSNTAHSNNKGSPSSNTSGFVAAAASTNKQQQDNNNDNSNRSPRGEKSVHHPHPSSNSSDMFFQYQTALSAAPFHPSLIDYSLAAAASMPTHHHHHPHHHHPHPSVYGLPPPPPTSHINDGGGPSSAPTMANLIHLSLTSNPMTPVTATTSGTTPASSSLLSHQSSSQSQQDGAARFTSASAYPNYGPRLMWNDL